MELQLEDIVRREDIDSAMEQDPAGERPAAAMQVLRDFTSQARHAFWSSAWSRCNSERADNQSKYRASLAAYCLQIRLSWVYARLFL